MINNHVIVQPIIKQSTSHPKVAAVKMRQLQQFRFFFKLGISYIAVTHTPSHSLLLHLQPDLHRHLFLFLLTNINKNFGGNEAVIIR